LINATNQINTNINNIHKKGNGNIFNDDTLLTNDY